MSQINQVIDCWVSETKDGYYILRAEEYYLAQRYVVAIMSLTGILVGYGHRVSLNIAITEMANKTVSSSDSCPKINETVTNTTKQYISGGVISWTNKQQNVILSSFYPGYLIGHVPSGIWSDKYGARYVFSIGMFISTITTLITPVIVVYMPWYVTVILRNIMGLGQSVIYTSISVLFAKWVPAEERSILGAFSFAANSLGIIFGNCFTGQIIHFVGNWPIGFYFWGLQGIVWCTAFLIWVHSEPERSPNTTEKEKEILARKINKSSKTLKIPWKGFAKDMAIWALIIVEIGHDFTIFTLVNNFPKYLSDILHYDLSQNSLASSLPYLNQWIGGIIAGEIVDHLIKKRNASVRWCRIITTTIGTVLPATFILAAGYMGCNGTLVIVMFSLNLLCKGPIYAGMKVNHLDMSVNFAGILMALTNGIGAIAGWISPNIINLIAPNNTLEEFQIVFWVVWGVAFGTNAVYVIFCTADRRKWDVAEDEMEEFLKQQEERNEKREKAKEERKIKRKSKGRTEI